MTPDLQTFYLAQPEPNKSCLLALRDMILAQDPNVSETRKYGMPCFCYGKKAVCYLWTDKKTSEPYLLLVEGKHFDDPALEAGDRSRMKIFRVNATDDLPLEKIKELLSKALDLYRLGILRIKG